MFVLRSSFSCSLVAIAAMLLAALGSPALAPAQSAYVRVSQVGYETGETPFRAYLMSEVAESGATFKVLTSKGKTSYSGKVGELVGTWSHSKTVTYQVYALDFSVPGGDLYTISVAGAAPASSPRFAVDCPETLYSGLLLNSLFFYQTQRDGADFVRNELRAEPGHLKDKNAHVYVTPPLDADDDNNNVPPAAPLVSAKLPNIDASGGWWDAGDYEKYVQTVSYTRIDGDRRSRFSESDGPLRENKSSRAARLSFFRRHKLRRACVC
jgi:endoglucanase